MNNKITYKMKKNNSIALLLFLSTLFFVSGCTKDAQNIKLPKSDPKLVVGCFISPQDPLITLTLKRSNPIFGSGHSTSNNSMVTDALVTISNGTNAITLSYNGNDEEYQANANLLSIAAGQTYFLTVSTPKGESVSASCTVPVSNITSLIVDFVDTVSTTKTLNVKWQDIPNQVNYYRIVGQTVGSDSNYSDMHADNSLQNDNEKNGKEMSSKLVSNSFGLNSGKIVAYDIYLLNIDAEYYKYQNSLDNYTYDDPFSEPSPVYTNIKGGLGIFAAYQQLYIRKP